MKIKLLFILCLMFGLSILSGTASGFELRGFVLDNTNETAEIGFGLDLPDASIVRSALDDGDELELACRAELHRMRRYIWDEQIGSGAYICNISKDMLKGRYVFTFPDERIVLDKIDKKNMQQIFNSIRIPLCSWNNILPGQKYSVSLEITLKINDVPEWIKGTLFFWSWDLIDPVYYEMQFDY